MMSDDGVSKKAFEQFASLVVRSIAMGNAHIKTEQIASLV
jgi:hypothetical protein